MDNYLVNHGDSRDEQIFINSLKILKTYPAPLNFSGSKNVAIAMNEND